MGEPGQGKVVLEEVDLVPVGIRLRKEGGKHSGQGQWTEVGDTGMSLSFMGLGHKGTSFECQMGQASECQACPPTVWMVLGRQPEWPTVGLEKPWSVNMGPVWSLHQGCPRDVLVSER